jgi:hypothetical protein
MVKVKEADILMVPKYNIKLSFCGTYLHISSK